MANIPGPYRDLLDAQFTTLATVSHSGQPQLSVVWFVAEGDDVYISLSGERQKTANLLKDNRCSVLITDPSNPYRYVELRGHAEVAPDTGGALAKKVEAKYGADLSQYDQPGDTRYSVRIVPERVRAVTMRG